MKEKKKIVLIDDDDINNYIAEEWIKTHYQDKADLMVFSDAGEAVDFLRTNTEQTFPDLIMCDLKMPSFNGFEFVEQYEKEFYPQHPETRIVILSSSIKKDDIQKSRAYPSVIDFVPKLSVQDNFKHIFTQYL